MSLQGWTLPMSATGRSSIVAPPPWHYSGDIITVDFRAPEAAVAGLLPDGMTPLGGRGSVVFADWCSSSDNDERVLADPAIGQYREAYVVLHALRGEAREFRRLSIVSTTVSSCGSEVTLVQFCDAGRDVHVHAGTPGEPRGAAADCTRAPARSSDIQLGGGGRR